MENVFLFLNLSANPKKSTPGKLAYISYFQRIEINATILFKSDVFAAVTVSARNVFRYLYSIFMFAAFLVVFMFAPLVLFFGSLV